MQLFGPVGDKRYVSYADHIGDAGNHLLQLISNILDISKIEAGEIDFMEREIRLDELVPEMSHNGEGSKQARKKSR